MNGAETSSMNRLATASSPYLLQHAHNPVDWFPWGEEALQLARLGNRPILLSIGYSSCHWCHVMAHECFENPGIAASMNRLFVNIKVDREERPDLDRIYQAAHQLLTRQRGGWPLTMFLTAEGQLPFFSGTYFPPEPRHGLPGFGDLLERVAAFHAQRQHEVLEGAQSLQAALSRLERPQESGRALNAEPLALFRAAAAEQTDREHGGFGHAPKFPQAPLLDCLLRQWHAGARGADPDTEALYLVALALTRMAEGGINDHLGGGFCRYSVDTHWSIPHFEKMLCDNGLLLALYAQLYRISGEEQFAAVARSIAEWGLREMRSPEGGFHAALDADSAGGEGRLYLWNPQQVEALLDTDEYAVFAPHFGLDQPANFSDPHDGTQAWHLRVYQPLEEVANALGIPLSTARRRLDTAREKLLSARDERPRPGCDDKVIVSWNAVMARGLAIASLALQAPALADAAAAAVDFIRTRMVSGERLLSAWREGRAWQPAFLDDHALLLDAVLELLQARWDPAHLEFALWLAERLIGDFGDRDHGGFWFTAHHHEKLLHRSKPLADDALPSGNGVAALALARLGHLVGETRYVAAAEGVLRLGVDLAHEAPLSCPSLLNALAEHLQAPRIVVIRGATDEAAGWAATARAAYDPSRLVFVVPPGASGLPGTLAAREPGPGTRAWVCSGMRCGPPADTLPELMGQLGATA
ncbi:MAG: thioredoxin domain-containing protein [Chromatiales bacterium]|nr:thioredoxin domain-containing protein [Chromatiales bacterium]